MPFTPTKLAERAIRVNFTFDGEPLFIEYRPSALSDDGLNEMVRIYNEIQALGLKPGGEEEESDEEREAEIEARKAEIEAKVLEFAGWIARVLSGWDYYEDEANTEMVPLTPERVVTELRRFPDFVSCCALRAIEDFQDVKARVGATSGRSVATSSRTVLSTSSKK